MVKRVDKLIGALIDAAEARAGQGSVLVAFTADHGSTPVPEVNQKRKMPGGRLVWNTYRAAVEKALNEKFGAGQWISYAGDGVLYFSPDPIPGKKLDMAKVQQVAADTIRAQSHIARVYTKTQLAAGALGQDLVDTSIRNGYNLARGADVFAVTDPYYVFVPRNHARLALRIRYPCPGDLPGRGNPPGKLPGQHRGARHRPYARHLTGHQSTQREYGPSAYGDAEVGGGL